MTGAMFAAQIAIRVDVGELDRCDDCKHGWKLELLYWFVSLGCILILAWGAAAVVLLTLTAMMACCVMTPCVRENPEIVTEVKETYIRLGFLPFGVCRKTLLENEITQWWVMFLFACVELALGTVFILGFVSIYFSVCYYAYLHLGWQMGLCVESLCALAFIHLNLPVILQYFFCCRSMTRTATAADKANKIIIILNVAADAEESVHSEDLDQQMQPSPYGNKEGLDQELLEEEAGFGSHSI